MLTIETKELEISLELKRKVEMICKFACAKHTFTNGNIKSIKETNIAYVMSHIIKVNNIDYLMFDECDNNLLMVIMKKSGLKALKPTLKAIFKPNI
ncbi:MAG: hypothetical protein ACI4OG_00240 [Bacilli bacterium]